MPACAVVLEATDVRSFIEYVMDHHTAPSTIVVCSSKEDFLETLKSSPLPQQPLNDTEATTAEAQSSSRTQHSWAQPTLWQLSNSQTLQLAFCKDVTHLRAYLATYSLGLAEASDGTYSNLWQVRPSSILALLNPVELHRSTSAFSAQGLNRSFAVAAEAAHQTGSKLIVAECPAHITPKDHELGSIGQATDQHQTQHAIDAWDEEISILNVTTRGFNAERGWVGRTVKLRAIAQRWCDFDVLPTKMS